MHDSEVRFLTHHAGSVFLPLHGRRIRHTNASPVLQVAYNRISDSAMSACYNCCLDPIEISENPSKILGKSHFLTPLHK